MFLSDVDIKKAVKDGSIIIKGFDSARLSPASYDVILDNDFIVTDVYNTLLIDPVKKIFPKTREHHVKDGEPFCLYPGETVLGKVRDFVGSDEFLIQISGKSSLARIGLVVHNTAGLINPGHFLNITLELSNINRMPIILRPGMEIAQLVFSRLTSPVEQNYAKTGRFNKNNWENFKVAKKRTVKKSKK
ncbi:MAG: dCTP deaminase [Candidatus Moraniibacteriota bacterium]|nr:MAG: dCTP deaminase [Candidatus Moranbacteria bacterium]